MTHYTPERGYGLDLSGPEPVWRGKKRRWNKEAGLEGWAKHRRRERHLLTMVRRGFFVRIPRHRIDDYIKKGLIDPARRDDL